MRPGFGQAMESPGTGAAFCFRQGGFRGALAATLGVVCPSFCVIYGISLFLNRFLEIPLVAGAFQGIKIGVGLLILNAGINMLRKMKKTPFKLGICLCATVFTVLIDLFAWRISSITLMVSALVVMIIAFKKKENQAAQQ